MTRMQRLALTSMTVAGLALGASAVRAQSAGDLVGTWQLVSNVLDQGGGKKIDQFGANPHGILYFESNGRYALVIVRGDLPKFAGKGRMDGTPEENKAVVQGSIGHFGTYSVVDKSIDFRIEHSTFPNWDGGEQKRPFKIEGDELSFFVATASSGGGSSTVTWRRMK